MTWRVLCGFLVLLGLIVATPAAAVKIEAITMPKADIFLGFVSGGLVDKVLVKEGDRVRRGSVLARLNDNVEQLELARLNALAEDTTRLEAAKADLAQKRADLEKIKFAFQQGAATEMEVEHASLAVTTAELQVRMEKFQQLQQIQNRDILKARIERMRVFSSIAGTVEEIEIESGESVEALAPVIRVVQVNPLWIDLPVPLNHARPLEVDTEVAVLFPDRPEQPVLGRIIHVASVADAASDTLRIRVEVPNPNLRMAGERILVDIPSLQ